MTTGTCEGIKRTDIPWQRLTTAYGRGSELPVLMDQGQFDEIANLIEHQSTLWQVTPWVLLFMLRDLKQKNPEEVTAGEIHLYGCVAEALSDRELESVQAVAQMTMLLDDQYLWPDDEEEDELLWEEEEPPGYEELPFASYYVYSYRLLREAVPVFERIGRENKRLSEGISELIEILK